MKIIVNFLFWDTVVTIVILIYIGTVKAIEPQCTFTGTSGFCAGKDGRFILPEHNTNIRALYLVNCDLTALTSHDFARFQSLSTLHINNCTFPETTDRSLLSDLRELKDLQITHSNLANSIKYLFVNNTGLNTLSLQGNRITQIRKDTFSHLTQLDTLDISNNNISVIEIDAFADINHLKALVLNKNNIGEKFNPDYLFLSPEKCGVCGRICPVNATSRCKVNEEADNLWRAFENNSAILFLEDNPICSKLFMYNWTEALTEQPIPGCALLRGDGCKRHWDRLSFFTAACEPNAASRRRSGGNNSEDLSSAPEVDGDEAGDALDSAPEVEEGGAPPAPESSVDVEGAGARNGQRDPSADGAAEEEPTAARDTDPDGDYGDGDDVPDDDVPDDVPDDDVPDDDVPDDDVPNDDVPGDVPVGAGDALPSSSVEVEEVPVAGLSQLSSRSILLGASGVFVAAAMVGGALLVYFRTKRKYRVVKQEEYEFVELNITKLQDLEVQDLELQDLEADCSKEATPLTSVALTAQ